MSELPRQSFWCIIFIGLFQQTKTRTVNAEVVGSNPTYLCDHIDNSSIG